MVSVCGFMVIKNGNALGYPWLEATMAVLPFVDTFIISEGESTDDTLSWVRQLAANYPDKVKWQQDRWPQSVTGFAIGKVTNACMNTARMSGCDWLWLLQADELYHPRVAAAVRMAMEELDQTYDGIELNFLHLQNNYQEVQKGAGYTRAIRAVRNRPTIMSYRDAWTFSGCRNTYEIPGTLPLVHANRTYWANIPKKMRSHADVLYPDLDHYRASAEQAEALHAGEQIPEMFTRTESPYAAYLPPSILPTLGWLQYRPRAEVIA